MKSTHTIEGLYLIEGLSKQMKEAKSTLDILQGQVDESFKGLKDLDPKKFKQFAKTRTRMNKALHAEDTKSILEILTELKAQHGPAPDGTK